jgi:predicted AlkP superfamily phosphohydrolase/phosphomutase
LLSFALYGNVSAPFIFGTRHLIHSYAYTIAIYGLLAGAFGVAVGAVLWLLSRLLPVIRGRALWTLMLIPFAALVPFVSVNAKWHIAQPRNVAMLDEYRLAFIRNSFALCLAGGIILSLVLVFALYRTRILSGARKLHAGFLALLLIVCIATLAHMHLFHGRIDWERIEDLSQREASDIQVVLIGLDGATWTVLRPMIERGELPHLEKFKNESVYGTLQVYGKAYSPAVWTTVVTGVKRYNHGILTHTIVGPDGRVVKTGSTHRKVPALWNVAGRAGLSCGLINYMASYPPEHISGFNFPNVTPIGLTPYESSVWPPELIPMVSQVVESTPPASGADDYTASLNHEIEVLLRLFERLYDPSFSFFTWYTHSTDAVEHRYWNYMFPESVRGTLFEPRPEEVRAKGDAIADHWRRADKVFEHINSMCGPNTAVIVVSDHGMETASKPQIHLSVNRLLAELGFLVFKEDGEVDFSKTLAYWPAGSDVNLHATGILINRGAVTSFAGGGGSVEEVRDGLIDALRRVRLAKAGKPLLRKVHGIERETDPTFRQLLSKSDVVIHLSAYTHGTDVDETLDLGEETIPLRDVLAISSDVSGAHHPRGVIMAKGAPFSKGPVFGRPTVETPVSDVLQRVFGRWQRLEPVMRAAQFLGIIDRATTLDIAQTMLYLLGLPATDYMDGRVLVEALTRDYVGRHGGVLMADYGFDMGGQTAEEERTVTEEELQRLRSLGYVD